MFIHANQSIPILKASKVSAFWWPPPISSPTPLVKTLPIHSILELHVETPKSSKYYSYCNTKPLDQSSVRTRTMQSEIIKVEVEHQNKRFRIPAEAYHLNGLSWVHMCSRPRIASTCLLAFPSHCKPLGFSCFKPSKENGHMPLFVILVIEWQHNHWL